MLEVFKIYGRFGFREFVFGFVFRASRLGFKVFVLKAKDERVPRNKLAPHPSCTGLLSGILSVCLASGILFIGLPVSP